MAAMAVPQMDQQSIQVIISTAIPIHAELQATTTMQIPIIVAYDTLLVTSRGPYNLKQFLLNPMSASMDRNFYNWLMRCVGPMVHNGWVDENVAERSGWRSHLGRHGDFSRENAVSERGGGYETYGMGGGSRHGGCAVHSRRGGHRGGRGGHGMPDPRSQGVMTRAPRYGDSRMSDDEDNEDD